MRLQEEIAKGTNDLTLFAWRARSVKSPNSEEKYRGILSTCPDEFRDMVSGNDATIHGSTINGSTIHGLSTSNQCSDFGHVLSPNSIRHPRVQGNIEHGVVESAAEEGVTMSVIEHCILIYKVR